MSFREVDRHVGRQERLHLQEVALDRLYGEIVEAERALVSSAAAWGYRAVRGDLEKRGVRPTEAAAMKRELAAALKRVTTARDRYKRAEDSKRENRWRELLIRAYGYVPE